MEIPRLHQRADGRVRVLVEQTRNLLAVLCGRYAAEGHAAGVERWAAAVWNAWSPQRAEVVALADVVLASGAPANRKRAPRHSR